MFDFIGRKCHTVWLDLKYGAILKGSLPSSHPDGFETTNSEYAAVDRLLADGVVRPNDVLVDIGCGKGRVLNWWIEHYPHAKCYGIEINKSVGQTVKKRLSKYKDVTILIGDAPQLVPKDGSLFYLFNPFGERTMQKFADLIIQNPTSSEGIPRRVVYYFTRFLTPFERPEFKISVLKLPDHDCAVVDVITRSPADVIPSFRRPLDR